MKIFSIFIALLLLISTADADYKVIGIAHNETEQVIVRDSKGNPHLTTQQVAVVTPNDWKDQ